jgi:CRP-like cAMP-binding protein
MNESDREKTCLPLLESAPAFAGVPPAALRFIAGGCHTRTGSRGRVLCERGQILDGFHVLVSGRVKLSLLSADGAERVLDIVLPGRTFGEAAAFLDQPCPLHAEALTDVRLVFVELRRVRAAIDLWPQFAHLMLAIVAQRCQRLTMDLERCCLHSAAQRVTAMVLQEARSDPKHPDRAALELPAAKNLIASSLSLSAETFSRELHGLARRGLVQVCRRTIQVPSLQRLREAADPPTDRAGPAAQAAQA